LLSQPRRVSACIDQSRIPGDHRSWGDIVRPISAGVFPNSAWANSMARSFSWLVFSAGLDLAALQYLFAIQRQTWLKRSTPQA
jgi:hypothetical protein